MSTRGGSDLSHFRQDSKDGGISKSPDCDAESRPSARFFATGKSEVKEESCPRNRFTGSQTWLAQIKKDVSRPHPKNYLGPNFLFVRHYFGTNTFLSFYPIETSFFITGIINTTHTISSKITTCFKTNKKNLLRC